VENNYPGILAARFKYVSFSNILYREASILTGDLPEQAYA
jgi:hypothetical protein